MLCLDVCVNVSGNQAPICLGHKGILVTCNGSGMQGYLCIPPIEMTIKGSALYSETISWHAPHYMGSTQSYLRSFRQIFFNSRRYWVEIFPHHIYHIHNLDFLFTIYVFTNINFIVYLYVGLMCLICLFHIYHIHNPDFLFTIYVFTNINYVVYFNVGLMCLTCVFVTTNSCEELCLWWVFGARNVWTWDYTMLVQSYPRYASDSSL
jgi:hypothetical protein